jgi:hypothetical protein
MVTTLDDELDISFAQACDALFKSATLHTGMSTRAEAHHQL